MEEQKPAAGAKKPKKKKKSIIGLIIRILLLFVAVILLGTVLLLIFFPAELVRQKIEEEAPKFLYRQVRIEKRIQEPRLIDVHIAALGQHVAAVHDQREFTLAGNLQDGAVLPLVAVQISHYHGPALPG